MSETIGSPLGGGTPSTGLKPVPEPGRDTRPGLGSPAADTVQEAYSFACLSCGYGWEQEYDIVHTRTREGQPVSQYYANGVKVPSPLLKPSCPGCGGNTVRIMRAGRVATVASRLHTAPGFAPYGEPPGLPS